MAESEARIAGLPSEIADAVVHVESGYDPTVIGDAGEIGLMQVRPGTAALLGFRGDATELAKPEINIHYGVTYLAQAWRLAGGDLCRTLMKYRAGHGAEFMSPLSVLYCERARAYLAERGSPLYEVAALPDAAASHALLPGKKTSNATHRAKPPEPASVYAHFKKGTPAASHAFWKLEEARVRAITARIEARWRRS